MRFIRNLIVLLLGLTIGGAIASALGARLAKSRLTSSGDAADDEFDRVAIFDGLEFASTAAALRRGSVLAWYAGGTVDLRGATLGPAGATLDLRLIFGGLEILVPPTWRVEISLLPIIGGAGDARPQGGIQADAPTLRVTGFAIVGGAGIVSEGSELDDVAETAEASAAAV
jgi:hypothetical protein